jgi:hypothetical protein
MPCPSLTLWFGQQKIRVNLSLERVEEGSPSFGRNFSAVVTTMGGVSANAPDECGPLRIEHEKCPLNLSCYPKVSTEGSRAVLPRSLSIDEILLDERCSVYSSYEAEYRAMALATSNSSRRLTPKQSGHCANVGKSALCSGCTCPATPEDLSVEE